MELVRQLLGDTLVALMVQAAAVDVSGFGLDAENVLGILLVGDTQVYILAQLCHSLPGLVTSPQLTPVVQVAGDLAAVSLGGLTGIPTGGHHVFSQGRGDAGEMEPFGPRKDGIPVEILRLGLLDGGVGPVVDAHGTPLGSTLFIEINAHPVAATDNFGGIHAVAPQAVHRRLADGVGRELGDVGHIHTVIGQGHRYVGFAAAEGEFHMVALDKALVVVGLQTQHQFTEGNDFCHITSPFPPLFWHPCKAP